MKLLKRIKDNIEGYVIYKKGCQEFGEESMGNFLNYLEEIDNKNFKILYRLNIVSNKEYYDNLIDYTLDEIGMHMLNKIIMKLYMIDESEYDNIKNKIKQLPKYNDDNEYIRNIYEIMKTIEE